MSDASPQVVGGKGEVMSRFDRLQSRLAVVCVRLIEQGRVVKSITLSRDWLRWWFRTEHGLVIPLRKP
jgi:hypothetical protein